LLITILKRAKQPELCAELGQPLDYKVY